MSEAEREELLEQQRKNEEKLQRAREKEAAAHEFAGKVANAALAELQSVIEKRPVNPKSEDEFWQYLFANDSFLQAMIFYNSHHTLFDRRQLKGDLRKVVGKMSYREFRSVILEQLLVSDAPVVYGDKISVDIKDACKHFGVDLNKIERELRDENKELAGMPEPKKAKKKKK